MMDELILLAHSWKNRTLARLDPTDGSVLWQVSDVGYHQCAPGLALADSRGVKGVKAVDLADGQTTWSLPRHQTQRGHLNAAVMRRRKHRPLVGVDLVTGRPQFEFELDKAEARHWAQGPQTVYTMRRFDDTARIRAISMNDGADLWQEDLPVPRDAGCLLMQDQGPLRVEYHRSPTLREVCVPLLPRERTPNA
jgi:hypothetical protein